MKIRPETFKEIILNAKVNQSVTDERTDGRTDRKTIFTATMLSGHNT